MDSYMNELDVYKLHHLELNYQNQMSEDVTEAAFAPLPKSKTNNKTKDSVIILKNFS